MEYNLKTREELISELEDLKRKYKTLESSLENLSGDLPDLIHELRVNTKPRNEEESNQQEIEARFRSVFELPLVGFAITSLDKGWLEVNSTFLRILGYSMEELKGLTWADLTFPEDLSIDVVQFERVMAGEIDSYAIEKRYICKNGEVVWTNMSAGCVRKQDGSINYFVALIQDISSQKKIQRSLEESEKNFRTLTENSNDLIMRFDRDFRHLYASPALSKYFDYRPEDFIGKTHKELGFTKGDQEYWERKIEHVFISKAFSTELARVGNYYFEWDLIPEFDSKGEVESVLSYSKDVTGIINAQNLISESEAKYRIIFANNPNPMIIYDLETLSFLEVNQAAIDLYGYSMEEFLSMTILDIRPEEDRILVLDDIKNKTAVKDISTQVRDSWRHLKKNGECIYVEVTAHSITVEGKEARHVLINDITRRKELEESLVSKSSLLEAQLNSVKEGILIVDENNYRILNNARYIDIFNIPNNLLETGDHSEILNYVAGLMLSPDKFLEKVYYLNNHPFEKSQDDIELKNGQIIERYSAPVLDEDGKYFGRIWSFRDITELKNADKEIKSKNVELRKANEDKDKFYSIIAHDLRGPIGGLMGMTELLADEGQYFSEAERKELSVELSESAQNAFNLLEQLLEWSRMESGLIEFNPQNYLIKQVVEECLKVLSKQAKGKGVEIELSVQDDLEVLADINMLQTIIRNLTTNAVKFTRPGGKVIILAIPEENNRVQIVVKDTGIGMSDEMTKYIFNSDYTLKRTGTSGERSSGLGLILCREFVERHGSKIEVRSVEGIGSEFSFILPGQTRVMEKDKVKDYKSDKVNDLLPEKIKLLVVEDDVISGRLISAMVKNKCREIIHVRNGGEAVAACRNYPDIDLILMDIQMPEMNGYEAASQIRQFNKGCYYCTNGTGNKYRPVKCLGKRLQRSYCKTHKT